MLSIVRETLETLVQDPKSALIAGGANITAGTMTYLEWLPQTDLAKASIVVGMMVTIPLIFSHWLRLCSDVYSLKRERLEFLAMEKEHEKQHEPDKPTDKDTKSPQLRAFFLDADK